MKEEAKPLYREVGIVVRTKRAENGQSQQELADIMGLTRASISNIERGSQALLLDQAVFLAMALGIKAYELIPSVGTNQQCVQINERIKKIRKEKLEELEKRKKALLENLKTIEIAEQKARGEA